ncbi:MAG: hypothetical protein ACFB0G_11415 [Leptolyngbyaceae cyanobacterium]
MTWTNNKLAVVQDAVGICAHCRRTCRYPWESQAMFLKEMGLASPGIARDAERHPRRYLMRCVHLNRDRADDRRENLKPLCTSCAMRFDALTRRRPTHTRRRRYL